MLVRISVDKQLPRFHKAVFMFFGMISLVSVITTIIHQLQPTCNQWYVLMKQNAVISSILKEEGGGGIVTHRFPPAGSTEAAIRIDGVPAIPFPLPLN